MPKKAEKSKVFEDLRQASADESAAYELLEAQRWGDEPACPRCGSTNVYAMRGRDGERHEHYRWRCRDCKRMYSVRTGTVLEESRLPLRTWVHAFWRACSSKKGVSALQISRECQITHKSALFLLHRIRLAMDVALDGDAPLSGIVEMDETYIGGRPRYKKVGPGRPKGWDKPAVFAMIERGGRVRAMHMTKVNHANVRVEMRKAVDHDARLMTDEASIYGPFKYGFRHETVNHKAGEYVRGDVTTNTAESFFALIKRGIYGTFHSVSRQHLHRYVSEFEFRYNTRGLDDGQRFGEALRNAEGKRLLYHG